jgi:hypothetical protein
MRGKGLLNEDTAECKLTADEGIEGCPDGGKREFVPALAEYNLLWDGAPSHLPSTHTHISAFHKYVQDKLGLRGVVSTAPYSAWYNPAEFFFSLTKRYIRKYAPATVAELVQRLREATEKVTGEMIKGWFRKSGYLIPGEAPAERPADPNAGVADRCSLPADARFQRREHVACYDSEGKLRREKPKGKTKWSKFDEIDEGEDLQNISVSKRAGVLKQKRQKVNHCPLPEEGKMRWTGLGPEPGSSVVHGDYSGLWQGTENEMYAVEAILGERGESIKSKEYLVKWVGFNASFNEFLPASRFSAGLSTLLRNWHERNKNRAENTQIRQNAENAKELDRPKPYKPDRKAKKGDVIAIYSAGKKEKGSFLVGKVVDFLTGQRLSVHWWNSKNLDGTWAPQFLQPAGGKHIKGTGGPFVGAVHESTVMDCIPTLTQQRKGKIPAAQIRELTKLAIARLR